MWGHTRQSRGQTDRQTDRGGEWVGGAYSSFPVVADPGPSFRVVVGPDSSFRLEAGPGPGPDPDPDPSFEVAAGPPDPPF